MNAVFKFFRKDMVLFWQFFIIDLALFIHSSPYINSICLTMFVHNHIDYEPPELTIGRRFIPDDKSYDLMMRLQHVQQRNKEYKLLDRVYRVSSSRPTTRNNFNIRFFFCPNDQSTDALTRLSCLKSNSMPQYYFCRYIFGGWKIILTESMCRELIWIKVTGSFWLQFAVVFFWKI